MTIFQLYLLTRLFAVNNFLGALTVVGTVASLVLLVAWGIGTSDRMDYAEGAKRNFKRVILATFLVAFLNVWIPTQKEAYIILGGYYATNNAEIKQLPDNIVAASNAFLKEYTAEAKKTLDKK